MTEDMEKIVSLCKRRGFVYPNSEIYGGFANAWDYGPLGVELKNNIKNLWWKFFVQDREDIVGIDGGILMNPKIWEASGHTKEFFDLLVECKNCHKRFRADQVEKACPICGGAFTEPKKFNLMFKTFVGPIESESHKAYLRPETAQAIFVNFKNVLNSTSLKLPFGIAQIGKAFRNEITPGNFIFRTREFEQMEIEWFIKPPKTEKEWQTEFENWLKEMKKWLNFIGIKKENYSVREHSKEELSHYSKRTCDIEYKFPFGTKELYGLAYRTDFDLSRHQEFSGVDLTYFDEETKERYIPHVIEPTFGVDRTFLAILIDSYTEEKLENKDTRVVLKLDPKLAPYKVAVFPLLANKENLIKKAKEVFSLLKEKFTTFWDDRGNIGKRYRYQDEIGTPFCITIDFQTIEDDTVTLRDRDTMKQIRINIKELSEELEKKIYGG